jgi:hypothetical protein
MDSLVGRMLGIALCGVLGGVAAWCFIGWLGLDGTWGALVAALVGMIIATAAFVGWTTLARALTRAK